MVLKLRVSIDGPTASGKTTLAVALSDQLEVSIFDSGLTYRALALRMYEGASPEDAVAGLGTHIVHMPRTGIEWDPILFDGVVRSHELFRAELDAPLSVLSKSPQLREAITSYHRRVVAELSSVVVVGRDIARSVTPDARCHVYLHAAHAERRRRRAVQVANGGHESVHISDTSDQDGLTRDYIATSPRGICLETDLLSPADVVDRVLMKLSDVPLNGGETS